MGKIDHAHFESISLGDKAFAQEILQRFISDSSIYKTALMKSMDSRDFFSTKKIFQQLKSSGQVFGANKFVENIKKIEMADLDHHDQYTDMISETYSMLLELIDEVKAYST